MIGKKGKRFVLSSETSRTPVITELVQPRVLIVIMYRAFENCKLTFREARNATQTPFLT